MITSSPSRHKGVSEIVSYVLLIVIAVGISVLVYGFISIYVPKEKPTCPPDIFLGAQSISCSFGTCEQVDPNVGPSCDIFVGMPDNSATRTLCIQRGCSTYTPDGQGYADCTGTHKPCSELSKDLCDKSGPGNQPRCTWKSTANNEAQLSLTLINKGLFTVDAAYIRVAQPGREVSFLINEPAVGGSGNGFYLFEQDKTKPGLSPGKEVTYAYQIPSSIIEKAGTYTLEIQPAVGRGTNLALCEAGVSRQEFTCT